MNYFDNIIADIESVKEEKDKIAAMMKNYIPITRNREIQDALINNNSESVRRFVLQNATDQGIIEKAANDPSEGIRLICAKKTTRPTVLRILSEDQSKEIREAVAQNEFIAPDIVKKLATDKSFSVLSGLISNKKNFCFKKDVLADLLREKRMMVYYLVFGKDGITEDLICFMLEDCSGKELQPFLDYALGSSILSWETLKKYVDLAPDSVYRNKNVSEFHKIIIRMASIAKKEKEVLEISDLL